MKLHTVWCLEHFLILVMLTTTFGHHNHVQLLEEREDSLIVKTIQGDLKGSIIKSRLGKNIYSFRGVRFAKAPIGELRFKAPAPPEHWEGVRNATDDGAACPQPTLSNWFPTSEDCLFLNVYTTKLPHAQTNPDRPVLVFFHAGGWYGGTGASVLYGPQHIMDEDIVLVTTNYRLGALGLLSTGDGVLQGNYAMKDQVATLRWVKHNIGAFGGNPDRVTIGGYSVGGASVWFHMFSPMSKGLFHQAISMSASINTFWDIDNNPMILAQRQAAEFSCLANTSQNIADCLAQKDAQEIASTFRKMDEWSTDPILVFTPVIESDMGNGEERFLVDHPRDLLLAGNFTKVPWVTGITTEEFSYYALRVLSNSSLTEDINNHFNRVAPIAFMYERDSVNSNHISQELKKYYFQDEPVSNDTATGLGELYADSIIGFGEDRNVKLISELSHEPVYFYKFSYQGRYSHVYLPDTTTPYGVVHHDDLIYLFNISAIFPSFKEEDPEIHMVQKLTKLWANFIQTGNPTPEGTALLDNVKWSNMNQTNLVYLDIGSELMLKTGLYQNRMQVWDRLFPISQAYHH